MAQRSRFFDSVASDRVYVSEDWAMVVRGLIGNGVVATGSELAVTENGPPGMSVLVATGKAFVRGYYFEVFSASEVVAISAADPTNPRIDRVVIRRDLSSRTATLAVIAGTPAASPTAPALTQVDAGVYEIPLARVYVGANVTSIVNANITDERGDRARSTSIDEVLKASTGHTHTGVDGQGPAIAWSAVSGKPSTFTPTDHTHLGVGTGGTVAWTSIGSKPTQFAPTDHAHTGTGAGGTVAHGVLTGVSADQHHAKSHAHDGADGSGTVAWGSVTGKPTTFAPTTHASSHITGGGDAITASQILGFDRYAAGGTVGSRIYVGTSTPASPVPAEGDLWVKG